MKKILPILIFIWISCSLLAGAQETVYQTEENILPKAPSGVQLTLYSNQKTFNERITAAWDEVSTAQIDISDLGLSLAVVEEMYIQLLYENPLDYYYVKEGFVFASPDNPNAGPDSPVTELFPQYHETDTEVIADTISSLESAVEEILLHVDMNAGDFEKVMAVHDYMVLNYQYDNSLTNRDITIMTKKTGVCTSYVHAFNHMMKLLGIQSTFVTSDAMQHAWNLVRLDGSWYHIDLTFDDPVYDRHALIGHEYALLSSAALNALGSHSGYDLGDIAANSTLYDNAPWRSSTGAIVSLKGETYWVSGKNLVTKSGETIHSGLSASQQGWNVGGGYVLSDSNFTGLAAYNGRLYYNTDTAIYRYDPVTKKKEAIVNRTGICGLYIDKNTLYYGQFDNESNGSASSQFIASGSLDVGDIRYSPAYFHNGSLIARIYKDDAAAMTVYAAGGNLIQRSKLEKAGLTRVAFTASGSQSLFYWDSKLKPLRESELVSNS